MNLLFTCAGRRNYLLEYFKEALDGNGIIVAVDVQLSAPALASADKAYTVPPVYDPHYVEKLIAICKTEEIKAIISLNDLELPVLSKARSLFFSIGVQIVISDENVIDICFDKWKSVEFALKHDIMAPATFIEIKETVLAIKNSKLTFPLVVKPRWGSASIGIEYAYNIEELNLAYKLLDMRLNRTMLSEVSKSDRNRAIIIQQRIEGTEFAVDILNNLNGKPVQVYIKEKLAMRAGETDKAILRKNSFLENLSIKVGDELKHIGNLDCDFIFDGKDYYLLELNPRFGGGYPFSHISGANFPAAIIAWLDNKDYDFSGFQKNYDQTFAKCDTVIKTLNNV